MPDEIGTETTRSDAPSADGSPFANTAEDTAVAVIEQQGSKGGGEPDPQGPVDAGDEAGSPEELKVVVSIKAGRATIGVQQPKSDPYIESFDDHDLSGLAQEVPAVTQRARARWEESPKHPSYERPAPPARRPNRRQQGAVQAAIAVEGSQEQQPETLRLF